MSLTPLASCLASEVEPNLQRCWVWGHSQHCNVHGFIRKDSRSQILVRTVCSFHTVLSPMTFEKSSKFDSLPTDDLQEMTCHLSILRLCLDSINSKSCKHVSSMPPLQPSTNTHTLFFHHDSSKFVHFSEDSKYYTLWGKLWRHCNLKHGQRIHIHLDFFYHVPNVSVVIKKQKETEKKLCLKMYFVP